MPPVPGEAVILAVLALATEVIKGLPPEVKAKLWEYYLEDVKAWRAFWGQKV